MLATLTPEDKIARREEEGRSAAQAPAPGKIRLEFETRLVIVLDRPSPAVAAESPSLPPTRVAAPRKPGFLARWLPVCSFAFGAALPSPAVAAHIYGDEELRKKEGWVWL